MREQDLMTVLLEPHVSEKSSIVADKNNQFVFKVDPRANKTDIKDAVEMMFEVKVTGVNVLNVSGKKKRNRYGAGQRKNWRKAYVTLEQGQDINFLGAE